MKSGVLAWLLITALIVVFCSLSAHAQGSTASTTVSGELVWSSPLVFAELAWLFLVGLLAPLYSWFARGKNTDISNLRGLNMPAGSVRSMLALMTVGSFVIVLVLGAPVLAENYENVLATFGTLTGSIIGFYFGSRGAEREPLRKSSDNDRDKRV